MIPSLASEALASYSVTM